jgi:NADPH:quinone reductase-like Zn-dependent oxidoreductase
MVARRTPVDHPTGAGRQPSMRAVVLDRYGPPNEVLTLRDVDRPTPGTREVLVRVRAAGVDPSIWHLVRGEAYVARLVLGLRRPKRQVVGRDVAGVVEQMGPGVTRFRPGDEVFGEVDGAYAEHVSVGQDALERKPAVLTFEQAAAVPLSANTALLALRDVGGVRAGRRVLINGASGGVGTFAVQLAAWLGAHVTGVCSAVNVELVISLGADQVIDHTREDFTRTGQRYDVILDLVGNHSLLALSKALTSNGTLVLCSGTGGRWLGPVGRMVAARLLSPVLRRQMCSFLARPSQENLALLCELLESGRIRPVIDRTYPLTGTAEAVQYVEQGHTRGKVVLTL